VPLYSSKQEKKRHDLKIPLKPHTAHNSDTGILSETLKSKVYINAATIYFYVSVFFTVAKNRQNSERFKRYFQVMSFFFLFA